MVVCGVLVPVLHLIYVSCPATSTMKQQWRKAKEDQWKEVVSREEKKKKKKKEGRSGPRRKLGRMHHSLHRPLGPLFRDTHLQATLYTCIRSIGARKERGAN